MGKIIEYGNRIGVDLSQVELTAINIAKYIGTEHKIIVMKSTVPVGTTNLVEDFIRKLNPKANFTIVMNPEFLKEGTAIRDFNNPDRTIIGIDEE